MRGQTEMSGPHSFLRRPFPKRVELPPIPRLPRRDPHRLLIVIAGAVEIAEGFAHAVDVGRASFAAVLLRLATEVVDAEVDGSGMLAIELVDHRVARLLADEMARAVDRFLHAQHAFAIRVHEKDLDERADLVVVADG